MFVWFSDRSFYVRLDGEDSFDLLMATVQGSILGPLLFALGILVLVSCQKQILFFALSNKTRQNITQTVKYLKNKKRTIVNTNQKK